MTFKMGRDMPKRLIAGNWKMNGLRGSLDQAKAVRTDIAHIPVEVEILICPPATLIAPMSECLSGSGIATGGQDCHANASGAHTGDISAEMLADAGCTYGIVGHSERRADYRETDEAVQWKALALRRAGLIPIVCIGETLDQRKDGSTLKILESQLIGSVPKDVGGAELVIAYEPVWAIGMGLVPENRDIAEAHAHIRQVLKQMSVPDADEVRLLYGGSVKPSNAGEILKIANVNGALVGGASLKAEDFLGIIRA